MTYKERIGWFLALQRIVKLSKNRVAPALPNLKKQSKPPEREISGSIPAMLHQSMSFAHHAKPLIPKQAAVLYRKDNVRTQWLNGGVAKPVSPMPILPVREGRALPKTPPLAAKLDRRLVVTHSSGHDSKRQQMRIEQPTGTPKLPSVGTTGATNLLKKSFAPGQSHPQPPLYPSDKSREAPTLATHQQIESLSGNQSSEKNEPDLEHPFPANFNAALPVQERETAVDQGQAQSSPNASASASTLHLDGTLLGRWAIQHLERVLSKPPSGITGVDPRATVPRSRVAPF